MAEPLRGSPLDDRERFVLRGMSFGLTSKEIGRLMYLSLDSVTQCATRMFRKLGAKNRPHAVRLGFQRGILNADDTAPTAGQRDAR